MRISAEVSVDGLPAQSEPVTLAFDDANCHDLEIRLFHDTLRRQIPISAFTLRPGERPSATYPEVPYRVAATSKSFTVGFVVEAGDESGALVEKIPIVLRFPRRVITALLETQPIGPGPLEQAWQQQQAEMRGLMQQLAIGEEASVGDKRFVCAEVELVVDNGTMRTTLATMPAMLLLHGEHVYVVSELSRNDPNHVQLRVSSHSGERRAEAAWNRRDVQEMVLGSWPAARAAFSRHCEPRGTEFGL